MPRSDTDSTAEATAPAARDAAPGSRPRLRAITVTLIVLCQSSQALAAAGIALFLPLIREDIGMTFSQAGSLAVASTATYALMQIPSGYLADRFGPKRLFLIGTLVTLLLSAMFAVLQSYEMLLVNQAVSGIFRAMMFAPGLLLVTSQFSTDRRATAMGLYVAGGFSSNIFLNSLGPLLVDPLGWRALFAIFSLVGLVFLAFYWRVGADGPPAHPDERLELGELAGLLRHPVLWLTGVIQFTRLAVGLGIMFWLPTFLVEDKNFSLQAAGLAVALGAFIAAPSNFMGGYISDRMQRPLLVIGTSLAMLAVTSVAIVYAEGTLMILLIVAVNGVFVQLYFGPLFEVPIRKLGARSAGTTTGFSNMCANFGGLAFAYTLGAVKDATGTFSVGFFSLAGMCLIGLVATFFLTRLPDAPDPDAAPQAVSGTVPGEPSEVVQPPE